MATDQTLPLPPLPAPSNPNQIPTAPLPDPTPLPSAARKLPIKRRSPPRPSSPTSSGPSSSDPLRQQQQPQDQPPFKFQRIWSESDELRFLQGLLGCGAQGLVFPRDLNIFYDRFSESMPQPYSRSQLSEKLRRLKNKHKNLSRRVAGGRDPARLASHDRDVLHLCSRLWDPANAATSPFAAGAGSSGNKRRRANNPQGAARVAIPAPSGDSNSHDYSSLTPGAFPDGSGEDMMYLEQESGHLYDGQGATLVVADGNLDGVAMEQAETAAALLNIGDNGVGNAVLPNIADNGLGGAVLPSVGNNGVGYLNGDCKVVLPSSNEHRMASAVLDVFEECLREAKADALVSGGNPDGSADESVLAKRWQAQRIDELDVLSRRLRLIIEDAAAAGH